MKIFVTGASGYIGGSVALALIARNHKVTGLVRTKERAEQVKALGIKPVMGNLNDFNVLTKAAQDADAVVNAADAEHRKAAETLVSALSRTRKTLIHTSGSSIVADLSEGKGGGTIYDEDTQYTVHPGRKNRVAINQMVLNARDQGVRTIVIAPTLIYGWGSGVNPNSIQVPWLVDLAKKHKCAHHIGPGLNVWSNVHIYDLVDLYVLALKKAPAGSFYYAENGSNSMREVCEVINEVNGFPGAPQAMTIDEASQIWGVAAANYTMGSNSHVHAKRARAELEWAPYQPTILDDIRSPALKL
jgi:nucleoside-diphosphate-sugar epimerase